MHRRNLIVFIVAAVLIVSGLLYARAAIGAGAAKTIRIGEVFTVELEENPSTGYSWAVEYDQSKLELVRDQPLAPANPIPGASIKHTWEFKAIASGRTQIKFSYARPWESKAPEKVKTFTLQIVQ